MTEFEVFKVIDDFRTSYCGCHPRIPVETRWKREKKKADKSVPFSVCSQLSNLSQTKEDIEFFVGIAHIKNGDPWENMKNFLKEKTPHALRKELYYRTELDNKVVKKFLDTSKMSLTEFFRSPPGGQSIATAFLRNLMINPWCYVNHFSVADGLKLNKYEVKLFTIVKELTHEKH